MSVRVPCETTLKVTIKSNITATELNLEPEE